MTRRMFYKELINKFWYWISWFVLFIYARLLLRFNSFKMESYPSGAKIFVANHPSTGDPFLMAHMVSQPAHILITDMVFKIPVVGWILRKWGHIPVVPGEGWKAMEEAEFLLKRGKSIILFPEGTISPHEGGFHEPRTGAARLALATGAIVIPVGIHIARERIKPTAAIVGGRETISHWYFRGPYCLTAGRAMRFAGDVEDRQKVRQVSRVIMNRIVYLAGVSRSRLQGINGPLLHELD